MTDLGSLGDISLRLKPPPPHLPSYWRKKLPFLMYMYIVYHSNLHSEKGLPKNIFVFPKMTFSRHWPNNCYVIFRVVLRPIYSKVNIYSYILIQVKTYFFSILLKNWWSLSQLCFRGFSRLEVGRTTTRILVTTSFF